MSDAGRAGGRHLDEGRPLTAYSELIHVVCPRCGSRAAVMDRPGLPELRHYGELLFRPRRLACDDCALTREWTAERRGNALIGVRLGGPDDPFFGLPLWLQTPCRGKVLWAYNERHLDALAAYVAATLRERGDGPAMSMAACLPTWIKAAGNRDDVLRAVERLRAQHADPHHRPSSAYGRETPRRTADKYFRPPY
ncbi:hypothetical protein GCM10023191_081600 [Actinoallomurus oryzae]|jgi:hypothetical protein|uniref:Uncharacterized protein n=1 Tax=Actinoallomurus oryzae TaxID=502180 RepID=A0ABP8QZ67_9ACTN